MSCISWYLFTHLIKKNSVLYLSSSILLYYCISSIYYWLLITGLFFLSYFCFRLWCLVWMLLVKPLYFINCTLVKSCQPFPQLVSGVSKMEVIYKLVCKSYVLYIWCMDVGNYYWFLRFSMYLRNNLSY
jgi:hypothetical protein